MGAAIERFAAIDVVDEYREGEQGEDISQSSWQLLHVGHGVCSHERALGRNSFVLILDCQVDTIGADDAGQAQMEPKKTICLPAISDEGNPLKTAFSQCC